MIKIGMLFLILYCKLLFDFYKLMIIDIIMYFIYEKNIKFIDFLNSMNV